MKQWICLVLCAAMLICCGCGAKKVQKDDGKIKVVATIFPPYDFAREIGGEYADVSMLLKPGTESHSYDPTPQDMIRIQECDLFLYVGGESDEWVNELLESGDKKPKKVIALMDCVDTVQEKLTEGMEGEEEDEEDEHVWTSPVNADAITRKISEAMCELDTKNAGYFSNNTAAYCRELAALDDAFRKVREEAKRNVLVFGDRFPFRYFADAYDLRYYAAFPGCSSETEPSAATISFLIDKVKEEKIPVVLSIEFSNGKVADTICESTGAKKSTFHSCHNVTQQELDSGASYVSLMQENLRVLREALC